MKKNLMVLTFLAAALFGFSTLPAMADCAMEKKCESGGCPMHGKDCRGGDCEKGGCPIAGKVIKKAGFILDNAEALDLTEAQKKTIGDLKLQEEKGQIQGAAMMQTMMLDVHAKLKEDDVDVEGFEKMIDDGTAAMAAAAKNSVRAYATLKSTLTPEQKSKMKELWKSKK